MSARAFAVAAALVLAAPPARACAPCSCGDATLTGVGLDMPYRNRVRLALDERFGGGSTGGFPEHIQRWTLRSALVATWAPIDRLTVGAMLPLVSQWMRERRRPWDSLTGLGDAELSVRGVVFRDRAFAPRHLLSLLAGLKMPTGPRLYDDAGFPWPEDHQPGSGSWDPFFGASWLWFHERLSGWVSASWRYPTEGRRGWVRGQSVGATVGVQYQPVRRVAVGLAAEARWAAADRMPNGADLPDSGGLLVALTPALSVAPIDRWLLRLAVQVPAIARLTGDQSETAAVMLSTVVDIR